jgi:hypothetical protein
VAVSLKKIKEGDALTFTNCPDLHFRSISERVSARVDLDEGVYLCSWTVINIQVLTGIAPVNSDKLVRETRQPKQRSEDVLDLRAPGLEAFIDTDSKSPGMIGVGHGEDAEVRS